MTSTAYTCKLCRKPGVAQYDETAPIRDLANWMPLLHCNHCADWRESKYRLSEKIAKLCRIVHVSQNWHPTKPEQVRERGAKLASAKGGLEVITKALATAACDYFRITNVWDQEFVELLCHRPDRHPQIINDYLRGLSKIAKPRTQCHQEAFLGT